MERSNRIPLVLQVAQDLDLNCTNCLRGYSDNKMQLRLIGRRKPETTGEKRALDGIKGQCNSCFKDGPKYVNSITSSSSCNWRAGIE